MNHRRELLAKIFSLGFRTPDAGHDFPPPVVSLEDFFEGNTDSSSIAPNLAEHPGLQFFYDRLKGIRSRPDVQSVVVNIYDLSPVLYYPQDGWPGTENIHILTSAANSVVQTWAEDLLSDGAFEGWPYGKSPAAPEESGEFKWWAIAWD